MKLAAACRKQGRHEETTFLIIDAQSAKNTDTAVEKGYDAGRKVSAIKRHIEVDKQGLPYAIAITTTGVTDRKGCLVALERNRDNPGAVQKAPADGDYTGKAFASSVRGLTGAETKFAKRNELYRFAVLPKRWVVGRNFSCLDKEQTTLEKLRAQVEYQPANGSFGFPGNPTMKTMNTFLDV